MSMPKGYENDEVRLALNGLLNDADFHMLQALTDPHLKQSFQRDYLFLAKCLKKRYEENTLSKDHLVKLAKQESCCLRDQAYQLKMYLMRLDAELEPTPLSYIVQTLTPSLFSQTRLWSNPTRAPLPITTSLDSALNGEDRDKGRDEFTVSENEKAFKLVHYFSLNTSQRRIPMSVKPSATPIYGYGHTLYESPTQKARNLEIEKMIAERLKEIAEERLKPKPEPIDEMDLKWLKVPKGQLTFDAEGNDVDGSIFFTRKAHVPNDHGAVIGNSGVTIGRGLDVGNPPSGAYGQVPYQLDLPEVFKGAKLNPDLAEWLISAKRKTKQDAMRMVRNCPLNADELTITRLQQHRMFNLVYEYMEEKTKILTTKDDVKRAYGEINWEALPRNVKDVLVDLTYRGDNRPETRRVFLPALASDSKNGIYDTNSNFYTVMKDAKFWNKFNVPRGRFLVRRTHLE
ncbi:pesticin C-terminus-like muramidase [Vibrio alginolyticus]|uniref:pesticin C-terminus-like muramidase n=1 Tax=Vibrio alginolyticus TaxID=663 RepID=UPI00211A12CE|nr:pesticin C-terminus-like muramidase [Vibrio alginolyticus]